jgi:hypothetical protein
VRLEEWTANANFRLRLDGGADSEVQDLRGSARVGLSRHLSVFADASYRDSDLSLPEIYLSYVNGAHRLNAGRFYLPLGIHDYSELYYVGFILAPLIKYYPFRGVVMLRSKQGLEWEGSRWGWSWELALVGEDGSQEMLGLDRPRGVVGRFQHALGRAVLGLNGYTGDVNGSTNSRSIHWYGLDLRLSVAPWVVRAEGFTGSVGSQSIYGYYVDGLYHPVSMPRWTFLVRLESVRGRANQERFTVGARVILRRGIAFSVNWIEEDVQFEQSTDGLNLQLLFTFQS